MAWDYKVIDGSEEKTDLGFRDEPALNHKRTRILDACKRRDIDDLQALAISRGGFLTDAIRCQAWPILLGVHVDQRGEQDGISDSWTTLKKHRDEGQVKLDVNRSFVYYPNDDTQAQLDEKKSQLSDLITEVLRRQPYLCYFQGYHDICQVFLLVLPPATRAAAVARLSALRIRDFMLPSLNPSVAQLRLIPDILRAADPTLYAHVSRTEPFFALPDTLTMFAHNVRRYSDIARLFDALLAREQAFTLYVFAQIVLRRRDELFLQDEPDMLHFTLSKLPQDLDLDALIVNTAALFERFPPESLRSWRSVSSSSTLKTVRDVSACAAQTLEDGHRFFEKHHRELIWAQRRDKVLRTAWANRALILAVVVGAGAVYFRKAPIWSNLAWSVPDHYF
ncbi:rab-GTPase-TBC domain-containing protein [Daldinia caldariorum]|uniref:rab-GTPase-TBC domain-containing protein n=1 Tax=Daldinia caldariorum TaxID=326644 RepID=UPI00200728BF|nr:rab-GTPase-TBC domain-containing protein [Daldinia caldariorum]KAI1470466.1 rab-GTPase-TBC domain-containing protein [Daldinia caldariorum]